MENKQSLLEKTAQMIFSKVIIQSSKSRNDGKVALCCYTFFSRTNASLATSHCEVISVRKFCNQYQIKSEMDFINYCKSKGCHFEPSLNVAECKKDKYEDKRMLKEMAEEINRLKAELIEKNTLISKFPVALSKTGN